VISAFGALNGWILLQGQVPMAAARDRLFPAAFGRTTRSSPRRRVVPSPQPRSIVELPTIRILVDHGSP
jgi:hypothetical protein